MYNEKATRHTGRFRADEAMLRRVIQSGAPVRRGTRMYENTPKPDCRGNYPANGIENAPSLAMVYSPIQKWCDIYDIEDGITRGTIFKELDKPFLPTCGNGGC